MSYLSCVQACELCKRFTQSKQQQEERMWLEGEPAHFVHDSIARLSTSAAGSLTPCTV